MTSPASNTPPGQATFARDLGLFDATMIGIGAMIGAGIFVLTGIAAGIAGPASLLSFILNGAVTLLTAFAYAELASAIPRAGGGYSFVRMAFPGATGFISGWMLWFAYTVACSLYALGFAGYFWEFLIKYFPSFTGFTFGLLSHHTSVLVVTAMIVLLFIGLNYRGAGVTGKTENVLTMSKILILAVFIFFGLSFIFHEPQQVKAGITPFFPKGAGGVLIAMGLTFIAFEGYDLIATVAEEIKEPERNIPRATFIALGVTMVFYLLILFVSLTAVSPDGMPGWEFLGKYKETAIVRAAEEFMPFIGVALIVFGGILSTSSALNATVMAASRVAFSMARDLWLPRRVAKIHSQRRTPHIAIVLTGAVLLVMALTLPIETVGSAASLIFLLTFSMVNLSVIVLRRKYPELPRRYKVPLYPVIPILGFLLNIFLAVYQFNFQPIAWYVTIGWIALGLFLYYTVFEKQAAVLKPQVLLSGRTDIPARRQPFVVFAVSNPDTVEALFNFAYPVAKDRQLPLVAVSVVVVPRQMPIHEGMRFVHHKEALMAKARYLAQQREIKLETEIIIAHRISDGILSAVEKYKADALVMGWKGFTNTRDRIFGEIADRVIRYAPCDLILFTARGDGKMKSCLLPTAGGPNTQLAASVLNSFARENELSVTAGVVIPENSEGRMNNAPEAIMESTLKHIDPSVKQHKMIISSKTVAGGIAMTSKDFDLVVIGAAKESLFRKMLFGEIPEKVARYSPASVLLVKKYEGIVKNTVKKVIG
ncbi:MAG: amino acid permease [Chlorobi bacterium]|nr:amino acid permease [Chlorobiota bacterium]